MLDVVMGVWSVGTIVMTVMYIVVYPIAARKVSQAEVAAIVRDAEVEAAFKRWQHATDWAKVLASRQHWMYNVRGNRAEEGEAIIEAQKRMLEYMAVCFKHNVKSQL